MTKEYTALVEFRTTFSRVVVVDADSPEEAAEAALDVADNGDHWDTTDYTGETFITRMVEGNPADVWDGGEDVTPEGYTERAVFNR